MMDYSLLPQLLSISKRFNFFLLYRLLPTDFFLQESASDFIQFECSPILHDLFVLSTLSFKISINPLNEIFQLRGDCPYSMTENGYFWCFL